MKKLIKNIPYRRKRQGLTNYKKRLKILLSKKPRLVVRNSLNNVTAQLIEYGENGDKIIASAHSSELKKMGWKLNKANMPSAYLVGLIIGNKAKSKGIIDAVLDSGIKKSMKGSKKYAVLAGAIEAGLIVPHDESILPSKDRLSGKHISDYANSLKQNNEIYSKTFSGYVKENVNPEDIVKNCDEIKKKILGAK